MQKHVAIFIAVSLLILCLGYALFEGFILNEGGDGDSSGGEPSKNNGAHVIAHSNEQDSAPQEKMRVLSTVGTVEKRRGGTSNWVPVFSGDELLAKDSIKTDKNASARLAANDNSELELREQSEIGFNDISPKMHEIDLQRGQLQVNYSKDLQRTIRVSSADNGSIAESRAGNFVIQNNQGTVSLAATEGEIELTSNNETVVVGSGQYTTATRGQSPGPVAPIPLEVMLRVAQTNLRARNAEETIIKGQTDPGARVFANGKDAQVNPDGSFRANLPRSPENKQIHLVASTPWGTSTKKLSVESDEGPLRIEKARVRWGGEADKETDN